MLNDTFVQNVGDAPKTTLQRGLFKDNGIEIQRS